jgi:Copper type II ascorbate-dependent monooxygenase, C-terminal domain
MRNVLWITLLVAGCGGSGGNGGNADLATPPDLTIPGATTITASIGPIDLSAGQEVTKCVVFELPNDEPIDVIRLDTVLAPGSHHLIFYKANANTGLQPDPFNCPPLNVSGGDIPLYIPETTGNNLLTLPTGVAYHFEAHQKVKLEAHYLNASKNSIVGRGDVTLTIGPKGTQYQPADIAFCGSVLPLYQTGVPPGAVDLPAAFWKPPAGIKVFGLTTHEHQRGTLMTVDKATGVNDAMATNLTMGTPYDNPPFKLWGDKDLVTFGPNEGLRWQCHYQNNTAMTYKFGESAESNEMCFFWAYYFPSVGNFIQGNPMSPGYSAGCFQ